MRISTKWVTGVILAIDQGVNTVIGGSVDETISARAGRMANRTNPKRRWVIARDFIDWLFSGIEDNHCYKAWQGEIERYQMPSQYR